MKRKLTTVQSSLFLTYSLIIITILAVFVLFFYFWASNLLKLNATATISSLNSSASEKLDIEIQKMNSVSMNTLYSNIVKDRFSNYLSQDDGLLNADTLSENNKKTDSMQNTKELIDILFAIIGPSRPVQQIYLYDFKGKVFGTGSDNRQRTDPVVNKPWYDKVIHSQGKKHLSVPMRDEELSKFVTQHKDIYFISLCRLYYDKNNTLQGIIEVKQYYDIIFKTLEETIKNNTNISMYVYNEEGILIYPLNTDSRAARDAYYFKLKQSLPSRKTSLSAVNPYSGEKELLDFRYSDYTGWTTIVAVSENKLLSPVIDFSKKLMLVAALILLFALSMSFFAAKKITVPISNLRKAIKAINLSSSSQQNQVPELTSDLNELEDLNRAFQKMSATVKQSHEDLMLSQKHEMHSKMLALQSQMNPHFLYNTLANISVMAEEAMNTQIIEMCSNLSDMLRYISADQSSHVDLSTEIEYTEKYLKCMKFRYGSKLSYIIALDDDLKNIQVPKMLIQPLVENAIKYGTRHEPPWEISISGYKSNTLWKIIVKDNGPGFDPHKLNCIRAKMAEIDKNGLLPSLELDGMGLLNIYIRLKLSYKNQAIFQIADNIKTGTNITIGGSL